jgi:hypothetical protein
LREPENQVFVDLVLPNALDSLAAPLTDTAQHIQDRTDPIELGNELLAQDVLESINNTMKRLAEGALAVVGGTERAASLTTQKIGSYGKEFLEGADESLRKSFRKAGEGVGPAVVKLLKRSLYTAVGCVTLAGPAPSLAAWLTDHYPQMFSWLEHVAVLLK